MYGWATSKGRVCAGARETEGGPTPDAPTVGPDFDPRECVETAKPLDTCVSFTIMSTATIAAARDDV